MTVIVRKSTYNRNFEAHRETELNTSHARQRRYVAVWWSMAICDKAGHRGARWAMGWMCYAGNYWKLQGCLNVTVVGYEGARERVRATSAGIVVESTIRRL